MYTPVYTLSRIMWSGQEEEIITSLDRDKVAQAAVRALELDPIVEFKLTVRTLDK